MNRHQLTYIEMYPEPVNTDEPSPLALWLGAAFTMLTLCAVTVFLFSL